MQLVLGLGNPGPRYRDTRHNVGFHCVEALAADLGLHFRDDHPEYREAVGEGPDGPLTLLEPLTYMNRSGDALVAWSARRGLTVGCRTVPSPVVVVDMDGEDTAIPLPAPNPPDVVPVVVCDDLNLPLGSIRIRTGGRDGGQNGLASVIAACGGDGVPRLRLGVGPLTGPVAPERWADYVLEDFDSGEAAAVVDLVAAGVAALRDLLALGPEQAGSRHNRRIRPQPDLPPDD